MGKVSPRRANVNRFLLSSIDADMGPARIGKRSSINLLAINSKEGYSVAVR
jgi:hypothetical protein